MQLKKANDTNYTYEMGKYETHSLLSHKEHTKEDIVSTEVI